MDVDVVMLESHSRSIVGDRLREERLRLQFSQGELAEVGGGVSKRTISAWENGDMTPNAEFLSLVAAHGLDVLYILTGRREVPLRTDALAEDEFTLIKAFRNVAPSFRPALLVIADGLSKQKS